MIETPSQIAARLTAPAASSAEFTYAQVQKLIIEAVSEEHGDIDQRPRLKGKTRMKCLQAIVTPENVQGLT